jgi:hypothetical protein
MQNLAYDDRPRGDRFAIELLQCRNPKVAVSAKVEASVYCPVPKVHRAR